MATAPDPQKIYRTLLTLYAKHEGLKITFFDPPKEQEAKRDEQADSERAHA